MGEELSNRNTLKIALLLAFLAHILLLVSPGIKNLATEIKYEVSFTLNPLKQDKEQSIEQMKPDLPNLKQTVAERKKPTIQQAITPNTDKEKATLFIGRKKVTAWIQSETQRHRQTNPQALRNFNQTFAAVVVQPEALLHGYRDISGTQYITSKLNGKDVCYLQNADQAQDDWGGQIVMFYDCAKPDKFDFQVR